MEKRKVFVTGATGLLGSHLLYFLALRKNSVLALKRPGSILEDARAVFAQYPDGGALWERVEWVEGDVLRPESLDSPIKKSVLVYHCAAVVSFDGGDRGRLIETNLKGTENVAALCLEHKVRLCYVSSIAALGDALVPGDIINEDTPVIIGRQHSVYSHSKGDAENIIWRYVEWGLDAVIVCPSIILGAGMWNRSSGRLYRQMARGIPFYTIGVSGYVDVRDVCSLMIRLAEDLPVKGGRFILNGGNYSYQELFSTMARINGLRAPRLYLRPWMTEVIWRLLAVFGWLTGKKPVFTKETACSSHHRSYYSNARILALYPDYHFYSLTDTLQHIRLIYPDKD